MNDALRGLRENLQKYRIVESEILQRKKRLLLKQPEISKCLDAVNTLLECQDSTAPVREYLQSGMSLPPTLTLFPPSTRMHIFPCAAGAGLLSV